MYKLSILFKRCKWTGKGSSPYYEGPGFATLVSLCEPFTHDDFVRSHQSAMDGRANQWLASQVIDL